MSDDLLRHVVDARDAETFVGRTEELTRLGALLDPSSRTVLGYVHGPGGVGKSALLRALGRDAEARGWVRRHVDGRAVGASAEALDEAVAGHHGTEAPVLLVLDGFEAMAGLAGHLRDQILGGLPASTRVVVASRQPPDEGWRSSGWSAAMVAFPLRPLDGGAADELLAVRGVTDDARRRRIARWADGLPLALTIAADAAGVSDGPVPDDLDAALASMLLDQVVAPEVAEADRDVLAVAAIAPQTDARMLAAVLPGVDADRALAWLRERSFAEPAGPHVMLHERVAAALQAELRDRLPDLDRDLRRRILEHLYQRIVLGEPWLTGMLPMLHPSPAIRFGTQATATSLRSDRVRPGDVEALRAAVLARGQQWMPSIERWFSEGADHVVMLRAGDAVAGMGICMSPTWLPAWAPTEDPVVRRWFEAMDAGLLPCEDVFCLRHGYDVHTDPDAPVSEAVGLANLAMMRRGGMPNPRRFICLVAPGDPRMDAFTEAFGYVAVPELAHEEAGAQMRTLVVDHGPGGVAHMLRASVLTELGFPADEPALPEVAAADTVRDALRSFHDPLALSASPLAYGTTPAERAESVRRLLQQALDVAFGPSDEEQLNRRVLERGYLDADGGHSRAPQELYLSRSTYFRRLGAAADRLAQAVVNLRRGGVAGRGSP